MNHEEEIVRALGSLYDSVVIDENPRPASQ
jgi:hypothetical protein